MHIPLFNVPIPGMMLGVAMGMDVVLDELIDIDIIIEDDAMVLLMMSICLHAMSWALAALMLKRMPSSQ
jgi:hypothetical protein